MQNPITVFKNDHITVRGDTPLKAIKDFELKDVLHEFNKDVCFIEETLTKSASGVFDDGFELWLIERGYAKRMKEKNIISIRFDDRNAHIGAFVKNQEGTNYHEIPIEVHVIDENTRDCRTLKWSVY